jgi:radical SAM enzyme (TIGR01210 family)
MRMPMTTGLLTTLNRRARTGRALFQAPTSYYEQVTPTYAEVWFPTTGCIWDKLGHCTTCNYGAPEDVPVEQTVAAVEIAMRGIAPTTELLWISAFDTFQEREVPTATRRRIFELVAQSSARTVVTETHPASVRAESVAEAVAVLGDRTLGVELGVETMDEFVRYACLNKPFSNAQLERAITTLHAQGAQAWGNLIVGIPFLTRHEVISGSIASIESAFEMGLDQVVLFPNHVKEFTLAYWLAHADLYSPPDLWYLRDVLAGVPPELLPQIHLAWLDLKPHPGAAKVEFEPSQAHLERLRTILDTFNMGRDPAVLTEAFELQGPERPDDEGDADLISRLGSAYQWLSDTHGESGWWQANGPQVMVEIERAFAEAPIRLIGQPPRVA